MNETSAPTSLNVGRSSPSSTQKIARILLRIIVVCTVAVGVILGLLICFPVSFVMIWALADSGGHPGYSLFSAIPGVFIGGAYLLWSLAWPAVILFGILVATFAITYLLFRTRFYMLTIIIGVILLAVAAPFVRESVYLAIKFRERIPAGADPATYEELKVPFVNGTASRYSMDANHVYCDNEIIPGADPHTLSGITAPANNFDAWNYAKDARHVYYMCKPIPGADPATFALVGDSGYATDTSQVYFAAQLGNEDENSMEPVVGADPKTFVLDRAASGVDAKDAAHFYLQGQEVPAPVPIPSSASFRGQYVNFVYSK